MVSRSKASMVDLHTFGVHSFQVFVLEGLAESSNNHPEKNSLWAFCMAVQPALAQSDS